MTEDRGAFKTKYPVLLPDTTPSRHWFWAVLAVHRGTISHSWRWTDGPCFREDLRQRSDSAQADCKREPDL